MATYIILNCIFLAGLALWWLIAKPPVHTRSLLVTLAVVLIFTAVFDSLIVGLGIVAYDYEKTLGLFIGTAPIEDFFYAILAVLLVPAVWAILGHTNARKN